MQRGSDATTFIPDAYEAEIHKEFDALLRAAEARNMLYYLLHLLNGWGIHAPLGERENASSMDFNAEINRLTTALILNRIRNGRSIPIPPQDLLFVFQCNMEQKGFYAALRNFISIATDQDARQEPWKTDEWSERTGLRTGTIIRNVQRELSEAGFSKIADEFEATHRGHARTIRNAIAHGNFRIPHTETAGEWVFGNYTKTDRGGFVLKTTRFTSDDFRDIFLQFLTYRLAFFATVEEHKKQYADRSFSFQAANQMDRSEILDCQFDKGSLSIKYKGTPLW